MAKKTTKKSTAKKTVNINLIDPKKVSHAFDTIAVGIADLRKVMNGHAEAENFLKRLTSIEAQLKKIGDASVVEKINARIQRRELRAEREEKAKERKAELLKKKKAQIEKLQKQLESLM